MSWIFFCHSFTTWSKSSAPKKLEEQLSCFTRGSHATSSLKSVLFTRKVAWQNIIELYSCSWDIIKPLTRASKWGIICSCGSSGSHSNLLQSKKWKWVYHPSLIKARANQSKCQYNINPSNIFKNHIQILLAICYVKQYFDAF